MAFDARSQSSTPVTVPAPPEPLGLWDAYRTARRNLLELIPAPAFSEPVLRGGRGTGWIMVMDPPALEHVLKTREAAYPKSAVTLRLLRPRAGKSLLISEGQDWRWQRRAMAGLFTPRALGGIAPLMTDAAEAAVDRIAAAGDGIVDLYPEMVRATCDVIADAALSGREALDRSAMTRGVTRFIETKARISLLDLLNVPNWVPRPGELFYRDAARMDRMMDEIIATRRARGPSTPPDLLDLLIAARDPETGQGLTNEDLRNNLLAFLLAGHETTALALTWALYLLAFDPDVQERARDEATHRLGSRAAGAADLDAMPLVRAVLEEALRLYPPAGLLTRTASQDDVLPGGHAVKAGATVMMPIYALHRHRRLWEAPDSFDPDRFLPGAGVSRHRFAYLPFAAGPRICIGLGFALMEAQIILATVLARFRFSLPAGFEPWPKMWFTIRPGSGMPLQVERL